MIFGSKGFSEAFQGFSRLFRHFQLIRPFQGLFGAFSGPFQGLFRAFSRPFQMFQSLFIACQYLLKLGIDPMIFGSKGFSEAFQGFSRLFRHFQLIRPFQGLFGAFSGPFQGLFRAFSRPFQMFQSLFIACQYLLKLGIDPAIIHFH